LGDRVTSSQRHRHNLCAPQRRHQPKTPLLHQFRRFECQPSRQHAVKHSGGTTALNMPDDGVACLETDYLFDFVGDACANSALAQHRMPKIVHRHRLPVRFERQFHSFRNHHQCITLATGIQLA
jgi:hypothetical protein